MKTSHNSRIWKQSPAASAIALHNGVVDMNSLEALILAKFNMAESELDGTPVSGSDIQNMEEAADVIWKEAIFAHKPVVIVGDYDADGITSSSILSLMFSLYHIIPRVIIPKRFSDGYGISEHLIDGVNNSVIICVDNGVAAVEPIKAAKGAGNTVIVLDHHLPQEQLPEADVMVDPHIKPEENAFEDYCGAGLAYKLAQVMWAQAKYRVVKATIQMPDKAYATRIFKNMLVLACIGTLADVMPLKGENRYIVKEGLKFLNDGSSWDMLLPGVKAIIAMTDAPYDEDSIGYTIAPIINAAGRMHDAGSAAVVRTILAPDYKTAISKAGKMKDLNEQRKAAVNEWFGIAKRSINEDHKALALYIPNMPSGIVGIVAGKIAEEYNRPTIVLSEIPGDPQNLRGSGRSVKGFDMSQLVEFLRPLCVNAGGHVGAAGFTVKKESIESFVAAVSWYMDNAFQGDLDTAYFYDMELDQSQVPYANEVCKRFAPYGEGCERPVFVVKGFSASQTAPASFSFMGKNREHISMIGDFFSLVGFGLARRFEELGCPNYVDVIGTISENHFRGQTKLQFQAIDIRPAGRDNL